MSAVRDILEESKGKILRPINNYKKADLYRLAEESALGLVLSYGNSINLKQRVRELELDRMWLGIGIPAAFVLGVILGRL